MNLLVTAGNTWTLIDKVRAITNVFTGRTGTAIALAAYRRGHQVTLLTSHPERLGEFADSKNLDPLRWQLFSYRTFEELEALLARQVTESPFDAVIHCAAVSDYRCAGVFAPDEETQFDESNLTWQSSPGTDPTFRDRQAGKVKSDEPELWLRLVRTPKLIDKIRGEWGFQKLLVKFKLEVDKSEVELLAIAEQSRRQSAADLMVANTLEGAAHCAFFGPLTGDKYVRVSRTDLADRLLTVLEERSGLNAH